MGRSLKLGDGSNSRGRENLAIPNVKLKARPAPAGWKGPKFARERAVWARLWANPVAALWVTDEELEQVKQLVGFHVRIEREGVSVPLGVYGQMRSLEDRLYLNPKARRTSGIVLVEPAEAASKAGRGQKVVGLDDARREQLRRGSA